MRNRCLDNWWHSGRKKNCEADVLNVSDSPANRVEDFSRQDLRGETRTRLALLTRAMLRPADKDMMKLRSDTIEYLRDLLFQVEAGARSVTEASTETGPRCRTSAATGEPIV